MPAQRFGFIDNMRLAMIVLVVCLHSAITYSGLGGWYYKEPTDLPQAEHLGFLVGQCFLQAFFMGALFMLAGHFAAASLAKRGAWAFIKGRLYRLGLPSLFYMLLINPFTVYSLADFQHTRHPMPFSAFYTGSITTFHFLGGSGPMWFAVALLLFCVVYALLPKKEQGVRPMPDVNFPHLALGLIALATAGAFTIRIWWPIGTNFLNMQFCYFSQYVVLFAYGVATHRHGWLLSMPYAVGRRFVLLGLMGIPVLLAFLLFSGTGSAEGDSLPFLGGMHWQSLVFAAWESCVGVLMSLGLPTVLREKWNGREGLLGRLPDSGFAVYMFHAPVVVGLALLLRGMQVDAVLRFLLLAALALPASFLVAAAVRAVPGLRELVKA